jgi:hypothetical protein
VFVVAAGGGGSWLRAMNCESFKAAASIIALPISTCFHLGLIIFIFTSADCRRYPELSSWTTYDALGKPGMYFLWLRDI